MKKLILFALSTNLIFSQINPENIDIVRDNYGVPHIFAKTDAEVAYGLAWAHAEDDFETIQLAYLAGNSMLSNHLGLEGAPADFISKFIGSEEIVDNKYDEVSDEYKLVLEGYALGLNSYAKKFPDKVLSVGMLSTVAGRSEDDSKKVWSVINDMEENGIDKSLQKLTNRWFTDEFIQNYPDLVKKRLDQVIETDPEVFLNVFKIYAKTEMFPWLKNISKPCLLMTGENDGGCTPKHNGKMANEIKNSKLVILPKLKHSFLIEGPDQVADNLISFINNLI